MIAAVLAMLWLLLGFMLYCCCVIAGRADRAAEEQLARWRAQHGWTEERE